MTHKKEIKKLVKEVHSGEYSDARETLKTIVEAKIRDRIRESLPEED